MLIRMTAKPVACLMIGLCSPCALADAISDDEAKAVAPSLAAFYTVDEKGRSIREAAIVDAIGSPNATRSARSVGLRPRSEGQALRPESPARQVAIRIRRASKDPFKAYRCERFGFYYTQDGRCIVPGLRRTSSPRRRQQP